MSAQFPLPLPFLRTQEAARFVGVSPHTLEKHRIFGTGPKFSKIGGRIIYAVSDLREWVERGAKRSTSEPSRTTAAKPVDEVKLVNPIPDGAMVVEVDVSDPGKPVDNVKPVATGTEPDGEITVERKITDPTRLGTAEAARLLGLTGRTLEKHRSYGTGPKYTKVGRRVFYASVDLTTWAERGGKRSTSDPGKTTVLPAIPVSRRAIKMDGGVR
jgi:predicted DNA-binding transcriptional regulator AlpA